MQFAEWLREPRHAAALGAGLSAAMVLRWWLQPKIERFRVVPGVWLLGVLPQLGPGGKDTAKKLDEFSELHGDEGVFEMNLAGSRLVVCCSWEAISSVLSLRPFKVTKPSSLSSAANGVIEGVFFSEGDRWKRERRIMAPAFNAKNVGSYAPAICEITEKFLAALDADCKSKGETNFSELLPMYTADVLCKTAFGQELRMLETRDSSLVKDVHRLMDCLGTRMASPIPYWKIPFLGRFLDGGERATKDVGKSMVALMERQAGQVETLVEKLRKMDGDKFSHEELVGNLEVLFAAGTDTTSQALSWAFYHLARLPELQQALAEEVKSLPGVLTLEQLDSLKMVSAMWLETLRVNGPAPFDFFMNQEPIKLAGRTVPPHTELWLNYRHVLKNSPEVKAKLGNDLQEFRPQRWLGPEGIIKHPPFDSLFFGHGARICLGRQLADYEGKVALAKVLQNFVLEEWTKPPLEEFTTFVVIPATDVVIRLRRR